MSVAVLTATPTAERMRSTRPPRLRPRAGQENPARGRGLRQAPPPSGLPSFAHPNGSHGPTSHGRERRRTRAAPAAGWPPSQSVQLQSRPNWRERSAFHGRRPRLGCVHGQSQSWVGRERPRVETTLSRPTTVAEPLDPGVVQADVVRDQRMREASLRDGQLADEVGQRPVVEVAARSAPGWRRCRRRPPSSPPIPR